MINFHKSVRRACIPIAVGFIALAIVAVHAGPSMAAQASDFNCTTLAGDKYDLGSLAGGRPYVVISFFGVNCIPCHKRLAQLNELWKDPRIRERAAFYAINADGYPVDRLRTEIARRGLRIDFPVIPDDNQAITNLYVDGIVPLTVLIDNEHEIVMTLLGAKAGMVQKMAERILPSGETSTK